MYNPYRALDYSAIMSGRRILLVGEGAVIQCAQRLFAEHGARVYVTGNPLTRSDDALQAALDEAKQDGGLNGLVYMMGACGEHTAHAQEADTIAEDMRRWFGGFTACVQAVLPGFMSGSYGTIAVGISDLAVSGIPGGSACAAVSGAILSYVRSIAVEYARYSIRANCVMTGYSMAEAGDAYLTRVGEKQAQDDFERFPAIHRRALPEDAANAFLFLVSDMSNAITGEAIPVNGGLNVIGHSQVWNRPEGPAFTMSLPKVKEANP